MSYRTPRGASVDGAIRVPRHARRSLIASLSLAMAAIGGFAAYNLRVLELECRDEAPGSGGTCHITRLSRLHIERIEERYSDLWLSDDPEHAGGYHLGEFRSGAIFQIPAVANSGAIDAITNTINARMHAESPRQFAFHERLLSRSSVWMLWACGVVGLLVASAVVGRLRRATTIRVAGDRGELHWNESSDEARSMPIAALMGFDIDQDAHRTVLVALTPGARLPIAEGPVDAIAAARDALEAKVAQRAA